VSTLIKVGFCIAYDWHLLKHSLPLVYPHADRICLSLDRERKSWAGEQFFIDEGALKSLLSSLDVDRKITLLEEDFHLPELTPMQNEVRQRSRMAEVMGQGGWHIQLDCDEYFLSFKQFTQDLRRKQYARPVNICCPLVTLYKIVDGGFLYVKPVEREHVEFIQLATNQPSYMYGRRNQHFNRYTRYLIIHQSWARTEKEIEQKLLNWGHKNDFDGALYLCKWRNVTKENFESVVNFHPINPPVWSSLNFLEAKTIDEFNDLYRWNDFPYNAWQLMAKNSRLLAKLRKGISLLAFR
jgi:hypothetical protein